MRARCASEWQRNLIAFNAHGDFVLGACKRKADPRLARQQWALRQLLQDRGEFLRRERPVAIVARRQILSGRNKGDGSGAFATDLLQHGIIVACADTKIAGDDLTLAFFGQKASEKTPALPACETFRSQGQ